jgi:hypothetical protein
MLYKNAIKLDLEELKFELGRMVPLLDKMA